MGALTPREKRLATVVVASATVAGLAVCEGGLRLYARARGSKARDHAALRVVDGSQPSDPRLWHTPPANAPGHDAWGFRNASVPERAEIVALGDSQTWGYNARASESWPAALERLTSRRVYNMALSGYGPVQYWALLPQALKLRPAVVIAGLYFGNDLYDAYRLVYASDLYRSLRNPALEGELKEDTSQAAWARLVEQAKAYEQEQWSARINEWLTGHLETVRMLSDAGIWPQRAFALASGYAQVHPEQSAAYPYGRQRTVMNFAIRLLTLEPGNPRVREGMRITREVLLRMREAAAAGGAKLLVVFIPTKEAVYERAMAAKGIQPEGYLHQVRSEEAARDGLTRYLAEMGIACLDLLPALQSALGEGHQLYPEGGDGHPTPAGYGAIGQAVASELKRKGW